jgi:hypothetical protein
MNTTRQMRTRKYWSEREFRYGVPAPGKPDGLFDAPASLIRLIGRQNAELLELLSGQKAIRNRRA